MSRILHQEDQVAQYHGQAQRDHGGVQRPDSQELSD